jgi:molybdenum cofactor cytidylyltransferase
MFFGRLQVMEAVDFSLAHGISIGECAFRKGHRLSADDCLALQQAGCRVVTVTRLDADEVNEQVAATQLAELITADTLAIEIAIGGRVNLKAQEAGLFWCDANKVLELNRIHEALTLAVLRPWTRVEKGQLVATLKIIPFAVPYSVVQRAKQIIADTELSIRIWKTCDSPVLIQTTLPKLKTKVYEKTATVHRARLASLGVASLTEVRVPHDQESLTACLRQIINQGATLILIQGASAICDRQDVIPAAIEASGGVIIHMGLPVDPGNLLLFGEVGKVTVIGLPGCARSPALNGFDWVLERVMAGIKIDSATLTEMAIGGVLNDSPARGLSRVEDTRRGPWRFAVVLLAAGLSTRMGENKLLLPWTNEANIIETSAIPTTQIQAMQHIAVVSRDASRVSDALVNLGYLTVENPAPEAGMASSIRIALQCVHDDVDAIIVCLGDMPFIKANIIAQLMQSFDPTDGRALCFVRHRGQRGNPVVVGRRFFGELAELSGDIGARVILDRYPHLVHPVDVDDDSVLVDIDDHEAYQRYRVAP